MSNTEYYQSQQQPMYNQQSQSDSYDAEAQKDPNYNGEKPNPSQNYDEAFKVEKPKFNDWPFAIFFILVCCGFIALAGICLNALKKTYGFQGSSIYNNPNSFTLNTNTVILFGFVIVVAFVLSFLIIVYARMAPRIFITTGLIINVVLGLGSAIYYFVEKYYSAAIVFLIFTLITAWGYWSARSRIPFSSTVLEITIDVMKRYPSTLTVSFISIIISGLFSILYSVVLVSAYVKYDPNSNNEGCSAGGGNCTQGKLYGVLIFLIFTGYYASEVFKNIIHVTIAGIYGTWYYLSGSDQGEPSHPALGALKRAMTYSFGSICFGSLIVSVIQIIQWFINLLKNAFFNNGDYCAGCGMLILDFITSFISWLAQYFNHYAYCYIALYGKSYIRSAKDTFNLVRFKGMDALINDCFVNTSLNVYSMFVGYLTALMAYLYLQFTKPEYNSDHAYTAPVVAFAFLISGQFTRVSLVVISSGISTFFVALARDPEVFHMTNPQRFDEIFKNYPQVLEKINGNN